MHNIEWIMACVTTIRYVVIINGYPTCYFGVGRGLQHGCSLSPLLFILSVDGLSHKIKNACLGGEFQALPMGRGVRNSHNFFVDDIVIFGIISKMMWATLHNIFYRFGSASGIFMNKGKLELLYGEGQ